MSLDIDRIKEQIEHRNTSLGIELDSTRVKTVLIGEGHAPITSGSHDWENRCADHIWTYTLDDIWNGIRDYYGKMTEDVKKTYDITLTTIGSIGFSAIIHGYMAFNKEGELLVPFRTWRNTTTGPAVGKLTKIFEYNIPQRWSIAHLYQAILNKEEHMKDVDYLIMLEGYVHWRLIGRHVLGIGDVAGMFPVGIHARNFDQKCVEQFGQLVAGGNFPWKLRDILPKALVVGENAGVLTEEGAELLDASGNLETGIPMCPPKGNAGTDMAATNSMAVRTGNVSAGTGMFAMVVLEKKPEHVYPEADLMATPVGGMVAMVHCNNCTSGLNTWVNLFEEFSEAMDMRADMNQLFETLYGKALERDSNCGGLLACNYFSGEHIIHFEEGRPLFVRTPDSRSSLTDFMRVHLYTSLGALKAGMDILLKKEHVKVDSILGRGRLFKTGDVGRRILAGAVNAPVSVMEIAGEGGAWGIALLTSYMQCRGEDEILDAYLTHKVFAGDKGTRMEPVKEDVGGFEAFMKRYAEGLAIEKAAVEHMKD